MEPICSASEILSKEPPLFSHSMPDPANEQLQVSQVNVFGTSIHHESVGPSTELKLGHGSCVTTKRISSESETARAIKRLKYEDGQGPGGMSLELKLALPLDNPWPIKKEMTDSDISSEECRLLLAKDLVRNHILPYWDVGRINNIGNGVQVFVWDCDTKSEHQLLFKQRPSNGSYVLIKNWLMGFVRRRALEKGDEIGLYWDQSNSRFNFSLLKQASNN